MSDSASIMPEHPPVTDWVNDFDHTDPRWTENPFPIWDELRTECPVVHTKRFLGCYLPTTYQAVKEIAYDTEHFSSRRVIVRDVRPPITRHGAADHVRSAGAQAGQAIAAAAVHAGRDEEAGAAGSRDLQRTDRRIHRRRQMRRRGALHQAHSGARHRPHARHPRKGRRALHQMDPPDPRARHQGRKPADAGGPGDDRLFRRAYRAAQEASDRRFDLDADEGEGQGRSAAADIPRAGLAAAAVDRRYRHHLERDRLLAVASGENARGPRPPDRRTGIDADARSRNSCAPIRR